MVKTLGGSQDNVNILGLRRHEFGVPEGRLSGVKGYPIERHVDVLNSRARQ